VVGNIERVEQEMMAIDPKLLVLADQEETSSAPIDGLNRAFAVPSKRGADVEQDDLGDPGPVQQVNQ
jgi:hypothetical protein